MVSRGLAHRALKSFSHDTGPGSGQIKWEEARSAPPNAPRVLFFHARPCGCFPHGTALSFGCACFFSIPNPRSSYFNIHIWRKSPPRLCLTCLYWLAVTHGIFLKRSMEPPIGSVSHSLIHCLPQPRGRSEALGDGRYGRLAAEKMRLPPTVGRCSQPNLEGSRQEGSTLQGQDCAGHQRIRYLFRVPPPVIVWIYFTSFDSHTHSVE